MTLSEERIEQPVRQVVKLLPVPRLSNPASSRQHGNPTVFELTRNSCRRPLWDKQETDVFQKFYCGMPALKPDGYCAACALLVYDQQEEERA